MIEKEKPSTPNPYRAVQAYYDQRARNGAGELEIARGIRAQVPANVASHLAQMEKDFVALCADSFKGTVLDAGCGNGNVLVQMLDRAPGVRVIGMDLSIGMLQRAKCRTNARPGVWGYVQANVLSLPIRTGILDGIACLEVLLHLPSKLAIVAALNEAERVLRPGGVLIVTCVSNPLSLRGAVIKLLTLLRRTRTGLSRLRALEEPPQGSEPLEEPGGAYHSSLWMMRRLRQAGFTSLWYRGWDRPIINHPRLLWLNPAVSIIHGIHSYAASVAPFLHLFRDRVAFRCIKRAQ